MSNIDQIDFLQTNLARQINWIAAADSKGFFVFAIDTAMLGVLAAVSPNTGSAWSSFPAIFAFLSALAGLAALLFLTIASFPRTYGPKESLVYFGGIIERDVDQFGKEVSELTEDDYKNDLAEQCHRNAEIANLKFKWVSRALISLYLSVLPWGIAIILLYNP